MRRLMDRKERQIFFLLLLLLAAFLVHSAVCGETPSKPEQILSVAAAPAQKTAAETVYKVRSFFVRLFGGADETTLRALETENGALKKQLADYDATKAQNEAYRRMLGLLKEQQTPLSLLDLTVIGQDPAGEADCFLVDKGTNDGLETGLAVVAAAGLAGKVIRVYPETAVVASVFSPRVKIGAYESGTKEDGMACGDPALAADGLLKFDYLQPDTNIKTGNVVVTSGIGEAFPAGLCVGTVAEVCREDTGVSCYAKLRPLVDLRRDKYLFAVLRKTPGDGGDE